MSEVSEWLKTQLHKKGWKQSDLARELGCSSSAVSHWVAGRSAPSATVFRTIEKLLGDMRSFVTVEEAARTMNKSREFVQQGLIEGKLPFGCAVKMEAGWEYYISPELFNKYVGKE